MANRFTNTEKWNDSWFLNLSASAKALFEFLRDNCNLAGFWERHDKTLEIKINLKIEHIPDFIKELEKSIILKNDVFFIKNFIRHQKNLPLNMSNNSHLTIVRQLLERAELFSDFYQDAVNLSVDEIRGLQGACKGLVSPIGKGKGKGKGKGLVKKDRVIGKGKKTIEFIKLPNIKYVFLTKDEFTKLRKLYGDDVTCDLIERVNDYAGQIGEAKFKKKYVSHFAVIKNWARRDKIPVLPDYTPKMSESERKDREDFDKLPLAEQERRKREAPAMMEAIIKRHYETKKEIDKNQ